MGRRERSMPCMQPKEVVIAARRGSRRMSPGLVMMRWLTAPMSMLAM